MYKCQVCGKPSGPRQPKRVHVVERLVRDRYTGKDRSEIAKEIPVCASCGAALKAGVPLRKLLSDTVRYTVPRKVSALRRHFRNFNPLQ